jgi:hypothetical protein
MRWSVSPNVVWAETRGEIQLYDTTAGEFQTLNQTAAAIWRQLVKQGEQAAVVAALAEEFGAEDENQRRLIATDTDAFVHTLAERGIIVGRQAGVV